MRPLPSAAVTRRDMTAGQRAMLAADILEHYEIEAAQRQAHGQTAPGVTLVADLPQALERAPLARDHAAAVAGASGRSVGLLGALGLLDAHNT